MKRGLDRRFNGARRLALLLVATGVSIVGAATLGSDSLRLSSDVTAVLGGSTVRDDDVGEDDLNGAVTLVGPGGIPVAADLDAYHRETNGDQLFSLDVTAQLAGPITVEPRDVVRFTGATFSLELDGSGQGIPAGARIDAITRNGTDLLLSFDVTVTLDGVTFADEDLATWDGDTFSMFLDASSFSVPAALDLDAAHYIAATSLALLSFDTAGNIDGLVFDDDDILMLDLSTNEWFDFYDGRNEHLGWVAADLDALSIDVPPTPTPTLTPAPPTATPTPTHTPTITATPTTTSTGGAALDIDADLGVTPLTDGVLVLRYLFGLRGAALINGVDLGGCGRCNAPMIEGHIASILGLLDIDDDGEREPLSDGLLVLRWTFGFEGNALVNGAVDLSDCVRCLAVDIEPYLDGQD